jgi:transposase-like protein
MVVEAIRCPHCAGVDVVHYGRTATGKQRFRCHNAHCKGGTFIREYAYQGRLPAVKRQIVEMSLNGSGLRDLSRVLHISPTTVIQELKKRRRPSGT